MAHTPLLRAAIARVVGSAHDRDEVFGALVAHLLGGGCKRLAGFRGDCRLSTWLTVVARNFAIDWLRQQKPTDSLDAVGETAADGDWSDRLLEQVDLERCLRLLDPADRLALRLVYQEGLSYRQAAEALRLPLNTLASRICRAKRQLLREMVR